MPAQWIARQSVTRQSIESVEVLAQVRRSSRKIDPRRRSDSEHDQTCSSTAISCRSVLASNPRFTSIRRPLERTTANSPPFPLCPATSAVTHRGGWVPSIFCFRYRVTYRHNVFNGTSFCRQNSSRVNPLASYSIANWSASVRLRCRRCLVPEGWSASVILPVQHRRDFK